MPNSHYSYEDWNDYFVKRLVASGTFRLSQSYSKGDANIEIFSALKGNPKTTIKVGYFSPMTLIFIHILNPETPGKNMQQEIEHLYKYDFDDEKKYGPPGLDFEEVNIKGISNYLDQGFNGTETIYYRSGRAIKSRLTTSYYPDDAQVTYTYHFDQEPLFTRHFKNIIGKREKYDEIKTVNLRDIFPGLNTDWPNTG